MKLIDADALEEAIMMTGAVKVKDEETAYEFAAILANAPAVDAIPVVHGRWITYPECLAYEGAYHDEHIVCSACRSVWNIIDNDTERFDYCPACGAKMDEEV